VSYASEVLADSPQAWWRLTDAASPFADQIGSNTLTSSGSVAFQAAALVGSDPTQRGADFTGGNAAAGTFSIPQQLPLVVESWIRLDTFTTAARRFLTCGHIAGGGWGVGVTSIAQGSHFRFTTFGIKDYSFTFVPSTGTIYHVVFVANANFSVDLYVNGTFQQNLTHTTGALTSVDTVRAGANGNGAELWDGVIQDVAVYNALSAGRIAAHFAAAGASGVGTSQLHQFRHRHGGG
jgi:hypothetical protein